MHIIGDIILSIPQYDSYSFNDFFLLLRHHFVIDTIYDKENII